MKYGTNTDAGQLAIIDAMIDAFAEALKAKAHNSYYRGRRGWDAPSWTVSQIKDDLIAHIAKNDPRDIAVYAAFWWNKEQGDA